MDVDWSKRGRKSWRWSKLNDDRSWEYIHGMDMDMYIYWPRWGCYGRTEGGYCRQLSWETRCPGWRSHAGTARSPYTWLSGYQPRWTWSWCRCCRCSCKCVTLNFFIRILFFLYSFLRPNELGMRARILSSYKK